MKRIAKKKITTIRFFTLLGCSITGMLSLSFQIDSRPQNQCSMRMKQRPQLKPRPEVGVVDMVAAKVAEPEAKPDQTLYAQVNGNKTESLVVSVKDVNETHL